MSFSSVTCGRHSLPVNHRGASLLHLGSLHDEKSIPADTSLHISTIFVMNIANCVYIHIEFMSDHLTCYQCCAAPCQFDRLPLSLAQAHVSVQESDMGEPVLGSLICGSVALGMILWNWHLFEMQKRSDKKAAREAAIAAAGRERSRISAIAGDSAEVPLRVRHDASSCDLMGLESPSQPFIFESVQDPSPSFVKGGRDRAETSPISPPISTPSPRAAEMGFFKDE